MTSGVVSNSLPEAAQTVPNFRRRRIVLLLMLLGLAAVAVPAWWVWTLHTGLESARRHIDHEEWQAARQKLNGYLRLYPDDAEAHLLMAKALVKDESDEGEDHLERAFHHLQQIGDDSPLAAKARLQEARLRLLILFQPTRAEALLRESLDLDGDSYEANHLMWKLADLTGRHHLAVPYFWKVYRLSSDREKPSRLREWFLSEFFPDSANAEYDRAIGVAATKKLPVFIVRLLRFREAEPNSPTHHATLGRYFLDSKDPKSAIELLGQIDDLDKAMTNKEYVSVLFEAFVDIGEFDKAEECFQKWPPPLTGYEFWRGQGLRYQLILKNDKAAAASFKRALETTRGVLDWSTMSRFADSLSRIGRSDEAAACRKRIEQLTNKTLTQDSIESIRRSLSELDKIDAIRKTKAFYARCGLDREAEAWDRHLQRLTANRSPLINPSRK